jgi:hypothetical protein
MEVCFAVVQPHGRQSRICDMFQTRCQLWKWMQCTPYRCNMQLVACGGQHGARFVAGVDKKTPWLAARLV